MIYSGRSQSLNQDTEGSNYFPDGDVTLFSIEYPFIDTTLCATRDGSNRILMTWNAEVMGSCNIIRIWRVIYSGNPSNLGWHNDWYAEEDTPDMIISGLEECDYKEISVSEGDLYSEWINAEVYDGYHVLFLFLWTNPDSENSAYGRYQYINAPIYNYCIGNAPSFSYNSNSNSFSIGTSMSGRRIIEFRRTDKAYGYPTTIRNEDTLNEMLLTSVLFQEYNSNNFYLSHFYANNERLHRWANGHYTVGVDFRNNTNKTRISNAIDSALSEINSVLNAYDIYFTRSSGAASGDITIIVDGMYNLFGITPELNGYAQGGAWSTSSDNYYIYAATVEIANDFYDYTPYNTYEQVVLEEILQSMGAGYDQYEYMENTIHVEFNYLNKPNYLTTNDKNILRLLYSDYVNAGDDCTQVSKALNIPKGVYVASTNTANVNMDISANFLEPNASYQARVFIVNDYGEVSYTSNWLSISTPESSSPQKWVWSSGIASGQTVPMDSYGIHPVTATEWNNFTARINEFRNYVGYSDYNFTTVSKHDEFTAAIYNEAVEAIKGVSGYGSYVDYVSTSTAAVVDSVFQISLFDILASEANTIVGYT